MTYTWWQILIVIEILHNFVGVIFLLLFCTEDGFYGEVITLENLNPAYVYKHWKVNWFGAICICIFGSLLCPMGAIGFWFYKLCTVGRK